MMRAKLEVDLSLVHAAGAARLSPPEVAIALRARSPGRACLNRLTIR
jgi:hypothetical protein